MSYTYLQEQGEESSAECFSDIPASVLLKLNLIEGKSCFNGNETESCQSSQFGMTCEHFMETRGVEKLMLSAEVSPVRTLAFLETVQVSKGSEVLYGKKWPESFAKLDLETCLWKTPQCLLFADLEQSLEIWPRWGMMHSGECFHAEMLVEFIYENVSSFTVPTIGKNEFRGSSHKRFLDSPAFHGAKMSEGLRTCEDDPIYLNPCFAELTMDWPLGWTDLQPLEMAKFQVWLNSHGRH